MAYREGALVIQGRLRRVAYLSTPQGSEIARDYIEGLPKGLQARVFKICSLVSERERQGIPPGMYKHLEDDIYEIKAGKAGRILTLHEPGVVLLLFGVDKKSRKHSRHTMKMARDYRDQFRSN